MGGLVYWLLLAHVHPDGLDSAWLRILAVSLCFGGFEVWRAARNEKRSGGQHSGRGLHGNFPTFIRISGGKLHDVNVLGDIPMK